MKKMKKWYGYCETGFFHFWQDDYQEWDRCCEDGLDLRQVGIETLPERMVADLENKDFKFDSYIFYERINGNRRGK